MPLYVYKHPETNQHKEIMQGMNEEHEYVDSDGIKWLRVFFAPNMAVDLESNPFDQSKFLEKTANAGTMGELWDRSAELSRKRASQNGGKDPLRENHFKKYSEGRGGAKHLDDH